MSRQRPFTFLSAMLIAYAIIQLLISYHVIETHLSGATQTPQRRISGKQQRLPAQSKPVRDYEYDTFQGCDPIPIDYTWGKTFNNQRVACLILSLYPRNKILMQFIGETYGKHCDGLYFVLDESKTHWFNKSIHTEANARVYSNTAHFKANEDIINEPISHVPLPHLSTYHGGTILQLNLSRPSHHTQRNTWEKVHRMYTYMYVHYLDDYDWFVRIDDDVLVSMLNLRDYLSYFDPAMNTPLYLGHTILDRFKSDNIVYNAGNLHVINRKALSMLGPLLMTMPSTPHPREAHAHCMDFVAGNDDPHLSTCFNALGVYPANTLDYQLKNRFMVFTNKDHYNIKREESWYWKGRPLDMGALEECCNAFAMNDHPWIHIGAQLEWRLKFTKMSQDTWNNRAYIEGVKRDLMRNGKEREVVPPRPCTFMFNTNHTFDVDKWYNIEYDRIPGGQRISFGTESHDVLKCHKCDVGEPRDIYWNNEWDRTKLVHQINDRNKRKFYDILQYFPNQLISTRFDIDPGTNKISESAGPFASRLQTLIDQALDDNVHTITAPT